MTNNGRLVGNVTVVERKNRDRSRTFYLRYRFPREKGFRHERVGRTESMPSRRSLMDWRARAHTLAYDKQREICWGKGYDPDREIGEYDNVDVPTALERYITWIAGDKFHRPLFAQSTLERRVRTLESFVKYIGESFPFVRRANQISAKHINGTGKDGEPVGWRYWREASREGKPIAATTIRTDFADLRGFLKFCHTQGWRERPLVFTTPEIENARPKETLIPDTGKIRSALAALSGTAEGHAVRLLAATGLRIGELRGLFWSDWNPGTRVLHVHPAEPNRTERTKRHTRTIPVGPQTAANLAAYKAQRGTDGIDLLFHFRGKPIGQQLTRSLKKLNLTPHDMRRWYISQLEREGCPEGWLRTLAGHSLGPVYHAYRRPSISDLMPYAEKIDEALG